MRVSTAFRYDQLSSQIGSTQRRVQDTQNAVVTGKRINVPSDDPSGTRQLLGLTSLRNGIAGYNKNLDVAKGVLSSSESAYSDLNDLVSEAQSITIQGATATMDQTTRDGLVDQIKTLQDRLVSLGNTQAPDGRYVFGGQVTDSKPFTVGTNGALTYNGNTTVPTMETGPGTSAKVGETGTAIGDLYDKLTKLQNSLQSGDINALSNDRLAEIKSSSDTLISARADVGRRLNAIDDVKSTNDRRDTEFQQRASDIGEVDYATAIVDYTAAQSAYQAALQVASKGFSMGLMDFIQ